MVTMFPSTFTSHHVNRYLETPVRYLESLNFMPGLHRDYEVQVVLLLSYTL